MAVVNYNQKVTDLVATKYWELGSTSEIDSATVSGSPSFAQTSLLKDGSGNAVRINGSDSLSKASYITAATGITLSCLIKINAFPTSTTTPAIAIGNSLFGFNSYLKISVQNTSTKAFSVAAGTASGSSFGRNVTDKSETNIELDKVYHLVVTVDYVTNRVKTYCNGFLYSSEVHSSALTPLTNQKLEIFAAGTLDFTVQKNYIKNAVVTDAQARELFLSARAIDEDVTIFYASNEGDYFGKGEIDSPITFEQIGAWGAMPIGGGGTIRLLETGSNYEPTAQLKIYYQNDEETPNIIEANPGDRVRIDIQYAVDVPVFYFEDVTSSYTKFVCQRYAYAGGVKGIEICNLSPQRVAIVTGSTPTQTKSYSGTLTGNTFVTGTPGTIYFDEVDAVGCVLKLYNNSTIVFSSPIAEVINSTTVVLEDVYNSGTPQALSNPTWSVEFKEQIGGRANQTCFWMAGTGNAVINPIIHNADASFSPTSGESPLWYGGVAWHGFWLDSNTRAHCHAFYWESLNTRKYIKEATFWGFGGTNGKLYGASAYCDYLEYIGVTTWDAGRQSAVWKMDALPTKTGTVTVVNNSTSGTVVSQTLGALASNDYIRVKHPSGGKDHYTRITISGSTVTFRHAPKFSGTLAYAVTDESGTYGNNLLVGSGNSTRPSKDIVIQNSFQYALDDGRAGGGAGIGYAATYNDVLVVNGNYFVGNAPLGLNKWRTVTDEDNTLVHYFSSSQYSGNAILSVYSENGASAPTNLVSNYSVNNNNYYAINNPVVIDGHSIPFIASWINNRFGSQTGLPWDDSSNPTKDWGFTGFDSSSTYSEVRPTTNTIFVRPQDGSIGQTGRAKIVVFNWQLLTSVNVDLSTTGLVNGQSYEIRDAEDFLGDVVASGTYDSGDPIISIPMTGTQIDQPIGWRYSDIPTNKPEFAEFHIIPFEVDYEVVPSIPTLPIDADTSAEWVSKTSIRLNWLNTSEGETAVHVRRRTVGTDDWTTVDLATGTETTLLTSLTIATTFQFQVSVSNSGGQSEWLDLGEATTADPRYVGNVAPQIGR